MRICEHVLCDYDFIEIFQYKFLRKILINFVMSWSDWLERLYNTQISILNLPQVYTYSSAKNKQARHRQYIYHLW